MPRGPGRWSRVGGGGGGGGGGGVGGAQICDKIMSGNLNLAGDSDPHSHMRMIVGADSETVTNGTGKKAQARKLPVC